MVSFLLAGFQRMLRKVLGFTNLKSILFHKALIETVALEAHLAFRTPLCFLGQCITV